jgi:hypothetical protein
VTNDWGDIPLQIFRRVLSDERKALRLDALMLRVFLELDGRRDLSDVAQALGVDLTPLLGAISRLGALGLIEPVQVEEQRLDGEFFEALLRQLSLEIGPVAWVVIDEALEELGYVPSGFPARKVPELIERLAREIPGGEARRRFQHWAGTRIGRLTP